MTRSRQSLKAKEWRECPKCRYPMLRAERLGGVSDHLSRRDSRASWLPSFLTDFPALLFANILALGAMLVVGYLHYLAEGFSYGTAVLNALLLTGELLVLLKLPLWKDWKSLLVGDRQAAAHQRDQWRGKSIWTRRRTSSKGDDIGVSGFLGLLFLIGGTLLARLIFPLGSTLLAMATIVLAGLLAMASVPALLHSSEYGLSRSRRRQRQQLMRDLAPDDWVCPNCLHSEKYS